MVARTPAFLSPDSASASTPAQTLQPRWQGVQLHLHAPPKPPSGAGCNGCGLCCLAEPCPLGMLVSRRRRGACSALRWDEGDGRYRCGVVEQPSRYLPWLPKAWAQRMALRWIASGEGCDAELEAAPATAP